MAKKIPGIDEPDGYKVSYDVYNERLNKTQRVSVCTIFNTYNEADRFLSEQLSEIEENGGTHFGGDIKEYYCKY